MLSLPALLYFLWEVRQKGRKDEKLMHKRHILHPGQRFSRLSGYTGGTNVPPHSRTHACRCTREQNLTRNPKSPTKVVEQLLSASSSQTTNVKHRLPVVCLPPKSLYKLKIGDSSCSPTHRLKNRQREGGGRKALPQGSSLPVVRHVDPAAQSITRQGLTFPRMRRAASC